MLDWISHQLAVWRYGAGVLLLLSVAALCSSALGAMLTALASWILADEFSGALWLIISIMIAPFYLTDIARRIAELVRSEPPPRDGDLFRKRMRKGKI
jgi:hypothetical protein